MNVNEGDFSMNQVEQYRKKPVVVEAVQLPPNDTTWVVGDILNWCGGRVVRRATDMKYEVRVTTVDGNDVVVPWGAYIVKDGKGFPYPCDAEIFEAGHEQVHRPGSTKMISV